MGRVMRALWIAADTWWVGRAEPATCERRQQARLNDLVAYARARSPYYRKLYRGLPMRITDPGQLPPVRKRELMEHFDEWVTDPGVTLEALQHDFLSDLSLVGSRYLDRYHVFTTSGTTGEPAILLHDADSWTVTQIVSRLRVRRVALSRRTIQSLLRHGIRSAAFFATGGHYGGVVMVETMRRVSPLLAKRIRVFSVLRPLPDLVAELNAFKPTLMGGYPSALALLAGEQEAGRLRVRPVAATCAGENLTPSTARRIEAAFGCTLINGYGASEVPALGLQCPEGRIHVNVDWYLFEPVDKEYRPVPPGVTSHTVLVTNLANRIQPIIRYDLGDRVEVLPDACPCGSRLPSVRVEGRSGDVLPFAATDGQMVEVLPLALASVVEEVPGVRRFQAIRTGPSALTLRLESLPGFDREQVRRTVDDSLHGFFLANGIGAVAIQHAADPPAENPRSGKFRQVWSETEPPRNAGALAEASAVV